jgi:hypothetical protein
MAAKRTGSTPAEKKEPTSATWEAAQQLAAERPGTVLVPEDDGSVLVANRRG